ncbi:MAG: tripartite tricarboxylate transporter permease, partial [Desulfovibrionaceae bacterium]|nr:tripartite tricarboxylate transporter permease [Desulfovibrionaceae bacterium]
MEAILMSLASAFPALFEPANIAALLLGVLGGTFLGVLPGLTPTMAVAIMVPFTFGMSAKAGLILLGGLYCSSVFSGAITAILVNIPGSPANVATVFDGYPMAQAGKGKQAIYYASFASMLGGIVGMLVLLFFAPPLAQVSLLFGPAETFWVALFGVSIIASLAVGNMLKGLISGTLGLCLSLIGMDDVTGAFRFTFGLQPLLAGIPIVAALIGIFALSQLLSRFEDCFRSPESMVTIAKAEEGSLWASFMDTLRRTRALVIGSVVGTIVGIIPGAGGQVAALSAYNEVKRWSSDEERATFGKGNPNGIVAAESANNAMCGGSLVPLFTLGIPGSPTAAVLLGGLLIHGLYPGHRLYSEHGDIVYTFLLAMLVAQVAMAFAGIALAPYLARVARVPQNYLGPSILVLCVIGSFATQNSMGDVYIMGTLGILMYLGIKVGFSPA